MANTRLPSDVWYDVIWHCLRTLPVRECVRLRQVSKLFDETVQAYFYDYALVDARMPDARVVRMRGEKAKNYDSPSEEVVKRYWHSFIRNPPRRRDFGHCDNISPCRGQDFHYCCRISPSTARIEEKRLRLGEIRNHLQQALAILMERVSVNGVLRVTCVDPDERQKVLRKECLSSLVNAVFYLLGSDEAWRLLHPGSRSPNRLVAVMPAAFWVSLTAIYLADQEFFQQHFREMRREIDLPVEQLGLPLGQSFFRMAIRHYPAWPLEDGRWSQGLSACLWMAIKRRDSRLIAWIMDQRPEVYSPLTESFHYQKTNVFTMAIECQQEAIINECLQRGWLLFGPETNDSLQRYYSALCKASQLDKKLPLKNNTIRALLRMSDVWTKNPARNYLMLTAIQDRDYELGQIIVSELQEHQVDNSIDAIQERNFPPSHRMSVKDSLQPFFAAVKNEDLGFVRMLLNSSNTLRPTQAAINISIADLIQSCERPETLILAELLSQSEEKDLAFIAITVAKLHDVHILAMFDQRVDFGRRLCSPEEEQTWLNSRVSHSVPTLRHASFGERAFASSLSTNRFENARYLLVEHGVNFPQGLSVFSLIYSNSTLLPQTIADLERVSGQKAYRQVRPRPQNVVKEPWR